MILHKSDWDKYPSAIMHTTTKNKSFVRLAGLYKKMGIENYGFHLALHNPLLKDVDPFSVNLTMEEVAMIGYEVKTNPWYYFREIARVPPIAGDDGVPLLANRGNIALYWCFFNHITPMLIQPRQTGKSVSTDILMRGLMNFWTRNTEINLLTKDSTVRISNVERLKETNKYLPPYLRVVDRKDSNNKEDITVKLLGNKYKSHIGQLSIKASLKIGRGLTSPIFHIDEIAYVNNIEHILPTALAAGGAARDLAREYGKPFGTVITTTAGRKNDSNGAFAYEIYNEGMKWTEKLFDTGSEEVVYETVKKNCRGARVVVVLDFNHRQLGKTDEWLIRKMEEAMSTGIDAETDFLCLWADGTNESPIPDNLLKLINDSLINNYETELSKDGYATRWYVNESIRKEKLPLEELVLGVDTSNAIGRDDIALVLRSLRTGSTLAVGQYNETSLITFSEFLFEWLMDYHKLTIIMENKINAMMVFDNLVSLCRQNHMNPFKRLFNWIVQEGDINPDKFKLINRSSNLISEEVYIKFRKHFGYATSGSGKNSRNNLYGQALLNSLKYTGGGMRDKNLIAQVSGLRIKNGRMDHSYNEKDDLAIAYMLTYWFLSNGRNLDFYNVTPHKILMGATSNDEVRKELKDKGEDDTQINVLNKINKLMDELSNFRLPRVIKDTKLLTIKNLSEVLNKKYKNIFNNDARVKEIVHGEEKKYWE